MAIPPEPILRAATRWLELLPSSGAARSRAILTSHSDFSDITPTQYETAFDWLEKSGMLRGQLNGADARYSVLERSLLYDAPTWFRDADLLVRGPDELPADAIRAADALGLGFSEAYACVAATWAKVDTAERKRIGDAGELGLAKLIETATTADVDHVAAYSDGLGFDLLVKCRSSQSHIEVKSTTRSNRVTVYLSRHEFETMKRDRDWQLVAVRLGEQLQVLAVGTVPRTWLSRNAPADVGAHGRWESFRLEVPPSELDPGMPSLAGELVSDPGDPIVTGEVPWSG
ncbi:protein NO VEIN domain-containing protein [Glycomyces tarimensis]